MGSVEVDIERAIGKEYHAHIYEREKKDAGLQLCEYYEIPYFLRGNPYITSGYRVYLSTGMCMKSLFILSNESVNTWSHLVGFIYFFLLMIYDNFVVIPRKGGTVQDHLIFTVFLLGYQICMFCSAGYHLFCCHSEKVFHRWFALDLAGVSIGLCVCYIPSVFYAYHCFKLLQTTYLAGVLVLTTLTLMLQLHPAFLSSHWSFKRLLLFVALVSYGLVPAGHWVYIYGGWSHPFVRIFLPKVVVMYILGILALGIYALKVPERYFPGKLNYIGSSHQWWHLLIILAFYWWHYSNMNFLEVRHLNTCTTEGQTTIQPQVFQLLMTPANNYGIVLS